jgi:hypothetical protein
MFTSIYSLLVLQPQRLDYDSARQKEAGILCAAAGKSDY